MESYSHEISDACRKSFVNTIDEDYDSKLSRLHIREREEVNNPLERISECERIKFPNLENLNPASMDEDISAKERVATDWQKWDYFQNRTVYEEMLHNYAELRRLNISAENFITKFSNLEAENYRDISAVDEQIENNIRKCRDLTTDAEVILIEKVSLHRQVEIFGDRLKLFDEADKRLMKAQKMKGTGCVNTGSVRRSSYKCRLGIPYFKTTEYFPAYENEDQKEIAKNNEIMFVRLPEVRKFQLSDRYNLEAAALKQLKVKRIHQLRTLKTKDFNVEGALDRVRSVKDIRDTQNWNIPVDFLTLSVTIGEEDREKKRRRIPFTSDDYERIWRLVASPRLSKEEFSNEEVNKLRQLAEEYGAQDWDLIANVLGTRRSGFICFVKWAGLPKTTDVCQTWTPEENDLLYKLCVQLDQIKNETVLKYAWLYIRRQFPHRTYSQIYGHWRYVLDPSLKKGRFSEEESRKLERLVDEGKSFAEIASIVQTRSSVQLRTHHTNAVWRTSYKHGLWTKEEEARLKELVDKYGKSDWKKISTELGTRNRTQCRLKFTMNFWNLKESRDFDKLIKKYGADFGKISREIGTKSARQCRRKYYQEYLGKINLKGRWTTKEIALFRALSDRWKEDFVRISRELGTRNVEECRRKYEMMRRRQQQQQQQQKSIKRRTYSSRWKEAEIKTFRELVREHGPKMEKVSAALKTKSMKQCHNMYVKLLSKETLNERKRSELSSAKSVQNNSSI